ncbi:MAG TPA: metallophosphoesterase family protein [Parafilimonas sp.]|nr:metallophosphoesterase family protein [Parafilimonas sp.]
MRIAVISDIHANLPALEEVLNGIDSQNVKAIYCLGDLVNQNVWNNEVVELIRARRIPTVRGNHDEGIAAGLHFFPFSYTFREAREWGIQAINYTLQHITDENRNYLSLLPLKRCLSIQQKNEEPYTITLLHGSPLGINEKIFRFLSYDYYASMIDIAATNILLTGNTHTPHHKIVTKEENGKLTYYHLINPGSVGRPKDGDWRASYVIITLNPSLSLRTDKDAVQVDFYRIKYDLGKAVKAIKHNGLPVYFGGCLITG